MYLKKIMILSVLMLFFLNIVYSTIPLNLETNESIFSDNENEKETQKIILKEEDMKINFTENETTKLVFEENESIFNDTNEETQEITFDEDNNTDVMDIDEEEDFLEESESSDTTIYLIGVIVILIIISLGYYTITKK